MSHARSDLLRRLLCCAAICLAGGPLTGCTSADGEDTSEATAAVTGLTCSGASPCGVVLAYQDGVPACSNGFNMGTGTSCNGDYYWGGRYQCVEYARRYLCERTRWHPTIPNACFMMPSLGETFNGDDRACRICDLQHPRLEIHRPVLDGYTPRHGDLYVENCNDGNNGIGHVAVIDYVSGGYPSWTLTTTEQNRDPTGRRVYASGGSLCIVHLR